MPILKSIIPVLAIILSVGLTLSAAGKPRLDRPPPSPACEKVCCMLNEWRRSKTPNVLNLSTEFDQCCKNATKCFLGDSAFYNASCIEQFLKFCTLSQPTTISRENLTSWEKQCCIKMNCNKTANKGSHSDGNSRTSRTSACFNITATWTNAKTDLLPKHDQLFQNWTMDNWTFFLKMASQSCLYTNRKTVKNSFTYRYPFYAKQESKIVYGYEAPPAFLIMKKRPHGLLTAVGNSLKNLWISMLLWVTWTLISGVIIWLLDRRKNPLQFPSSFWEGVCEGTWWAVVTMTTVGYGDKTPKSLLARIYSAVWMIVGMVIFSVFTGEIASNLTSADVLPQNSAFGKQIAVPVHSRRCFHEELRKAKNVTEKNSRKSLLEYLDTESPQKRIVLHGCREIDKGRSLQAVRQLEQHYIGISIATVGKDSLQLINCVGEKVKDHHGDLDQKASGKPSDDCDFDKDEYGGAERQDDRLILTVYVSGGLVVLMFIAGSVWDLTKAKNHRKKKEVRVEDYGSVGMRGAESFEQIEITVIKEQDERGRKS